MATLLDLFKSQKKELYGLSGRAIIESRGLINPPRGAALLTSSPDAVADLIGNQIGGALGGSANRPSDTIFKGKGVFDKPISLFKTQQGLRNAIEPGTKYYIKDTPAPASLIASFTQGGSSIAGMAANLAIKAVTKGGLKKLAKDLKDKDNNEIFGPKFSKDKDGKEVKREDMLFSTHFKDKTGLKLRDSKGAGTYWDEGQKKLLEAISITEDELEGKEYANHVITTFQTIPAKGKDSLKVPFVGSVSGISEEVTPTWTNFKYLGSPFSVYRYGGVERALRFNLKLYYTTTIERDVMITKINYLKSLAFPDKDIRAITFGTDASGKNNSQYAMAPNLVRVSIGDLYKNIPGFIESLSFEIDDNAPWPNSANVSNSKMTSGLGGSDNMDDGSTLLYPSVVDVSIGFKIIEDHAISNGEGNTKTYRYDFDGRETDKTNKEIKKSIAAFLKKLGTLPKEE